MIRTLRDQIKARVIARDPLSLAEMDQIAATLGVIANKYEPIDNVVSLPARRAATASDDKGAA